MCGRYGDAVRFQLAMVAPRKTYPANMQLVYRGVRYRPAALKLFVEQGGWGSEYRRKPEEPKDWRVTD